MSNGEEQSSGVVSLTHATTPSVLRCNLCDELCVVDEGDRGITQHVWRKHSDLPRYSCFFCPSGSATSLTKIRDHLVSWHPEKNPDDFRDNHIAAEFYLKALRRCFDEKGIELMGRVKSTSETSHSHRHVGGDTSPAPKKLLPSIHQAESSHIELVPPTDASVASSMTLQQQTPTEHDVEMDDDDLSVIQEFDLGSSNRGVNLKGRRVNRERKCDSRLCQLCFATVNAAYSTMQYHVWRFHMDCKRFECPMCPYGSCTKQPVQCNMRAIHDASGFVEPTNNTEAYWELYRERRNECFAYRNAHEGLQKNIG